jgi:hypothetical protein
MGQPGYPFLGHPAELERRQCFQRARQAIDLCAVWSFVHEPTNSGATTLDMKIHGLRTILEGPPPPIPPTANGLDIYHINAAIIDSLGEDMRSLRCDVTRTRDLYRAMIAICDRFLLNTRQFEQDMNYSARKLCDRARQEEARETLRLDEQRFGQLLRSLDSMFCLQHLFQSEHL